LVITDRLEQLTHTLEQQHPRGLQQFRALLASLTIDEEIIDELMPDPVPEDGYHRNPIFQGPDFEVVVATWPCGGGTLIHDHGASESNGVVRVLTGTLYNRIYEKVADDKVRFVRALAHDVDDLIDVPLGLIHAMGNDGDELAMSLHLYSPAIEDVTYWDPQTLGVYPPEK